MPYKDKDKERIYRKAWRAAHRHEISAANKAYYLKNTEKIRMRFQRWYNDTAYVRLTHAEERHAYYVKYYAEHRDEILLRAKLYAAMNTEKIRAYHAIWLKENPEKDKERGQRYRARKNGSAINNFTATQWRAMQEHYGHRCAYCHKRAKGHLTRDHITPLSKGGDHTLSNIIPACHSCNSRKKDRGVLSPVQPLLLIC